VKISNKIEDFIRDWYTLKTFLITKTLRVFVITRDATPVGLVAKAYGNEVSLIRDKINKKDTIYKCFISDKEENCKFFIQTTIFAFL